MSRCNAVIQHGPGHQSKTGCQKRVPHNQHHVRIGYDDFYWHGNEGITGSFNESPEEEDELEPYHQLTIGWLMMVFDQLDRKAHNYGKIDWRFGALGAFVELGEAVNELPWRPWRISDQRSPTEEEMVKATEEIADAICTIVRIAGQIGIKAPDLEDALIRHVEKKQERLSNGIDH